MKRISIFLCSLLLAACLSTQTDESTSLQSSANTSDSNTKEVTQDAASMGEPIRVPGTVFMRKHCAVNSSMSDTNEVNCGEKMHSAATIFVAKVNPSGSLTQISRVQSNSNGEFELHLLPGEYSLIAEMKPIAQSKRFTFSVNDDSTHSLSVELLLKHIPR